jgi:RHS repeat-associated protein
VWPYISKAIEYRWEDSNTEHFTLSASGPSAQPEGLFAKRKPSGEHIKITAESQFDEETAAHATLPADFAPSDTVTPASGSDPLVNKVTGLTSYTIPSLGLPRKVTYGNLRKLTTDYGSGYTETVTTTYKPANGALTGLVDTISTTATGGGYTDNAPTKIFTYWSNGATATPLVATEEIDAADNALDLKTTYTRDSPRGRVTNTQITNTTATGLQAIGDYSVSSVTAFDDKFDLPSTAKNAAPYYHPTTTLYDPTLGMPTSVTDANNAQITTQYDALGRPKQVKDLLKGLQTDTTYTWDTTVTVSPPSGVTGLTLTSVYKVEVTATAQPKVTSYYDRLGRVIRTVKESYGTQTATVDTVYNVLGQVVAVSNPYASSATDWTKTTYDDLGRVKTVTAPNGTVTTNNYNGRATIVTIDAPNLGGADPAAQTNATLVDAKGRTVKVWNADNVPTFTDTLGSTTTPASIEFKLDGFGRMRETVLKDQTAHITATYDALGRQATLNDPDKGNWSYTNNALGQVVSQTDARSTVTASTFDHLGRPLTRTATESGSGAPVETGKWFYYDSAADAATQRVDKGTKGWIGAVAREEHTLVNAPGYTDPGSTRFYYYDTTKGLPEIALSQIDGKWFYTHTTYDAYARPGTVRYYWRPAGHEAAGDYPYLWETVGFTYSYDGKSFVTQITDTSDAARVWWKANAGDGYDHLGRAVKVQKGNAHWTVRSYRPSDGVLESIATGPSIGSTSIQNQTFGFDGLGNLRSRTGSGGTETLGYDLLNRLTSSNQGATTYFDNGNIKTKIGVDGTASGTYVYGSSQPHAVTSAFGYSMTYDANGNLLTRTGGGETWGLKWTGFDKPRWMAKVGATTAGNEFLYDANRSRVLNLEFDAVTGSGTSAVPSHYTRKKLYAAGAAMEVDYENTATSGAPVWKQKAVRVYVSGPDGSVGALELPPADVGGTTNAYIYHTDHLGSIESITRYGDATVTFATDRSNKAGRFSEDAWGQRRNPLTWSGVPSTTDDGGADSLTPRGFTGHEMLDGSGLVHMNGRVYDPLLGRMLSADIVVQAPGNLQSYNRYSYVFNNPLSYTDPSGFVTTAEQEKEREERQRRQEEARKRASADARSNYIREHGVTDYLTHWSEVENIAAAAGDAAWNAAGKSETSAKPAKEESDIAAPKARPMPWLEVFAPIADFGRTLRRALDRNNDPEDSLKAMGELFTGPAMAIQDAQENREEIAQSLRTPEGRYRMAGTLGLFALSYRLPQRVAPNVTTGDGFLFGGVKMKAPFDIPVQRFGTMNLDRVDHWGFGFLGENRLLNRTFLAIKTEWNPLTTFTEGVIPKGTPITFGIAGPQGLRYPGGHLQFTVMSREVINQSSSYRKR